MKKRTLYIVSGIIILLVLLAGIKKIQVSTMIENGKNMKMPPETVTSIAVKAESWESTLFGVGSVEAIKGVLVSAELPGKVASINFEAGNEVAAGDVLLRMDTASEEAQLAAAEARLNIAKLHYERSKKLLGSKTISQSEYDRADSDYNLALAEAKSIKVSIDKKVIKAPFAGRLGIREVDAGQVLSAGAPIVTLQSLGSVYVNFSLPQQDIKKISLGNTVRLSSDALSGTVPEGKITAISPEINQKSRSVRVQATVDNPEENLLPGMFVKVQVVLSEKLDVLVVPSTAVSFATYGNSVFVIEDRKEGGKTLRQSFVRLGERRGDFVSVADGVKEGESIVSTGIFRLRNDVAVVIDNTLNPSFKYSPKVEDN